MKKREKKEVYHGVFGWRKILTFIVLIVLVWAVWNVFFSYERCNTKDCFDKYLMDCDKAVFVSGNDMIFKYIIRGPEGDDCVIDVELLQGELNNEDSMKLQGESMQCKLPRGLVASPESDISLCHGLLKEGLQDLVIKKLHTYLVQNIGQLNLEMAGLPGV
jgi:hypothetical protein